MAQTIIDNIYNDEQQHFIMTGKTERSASKLLYYKD